MEENLVCIKDDVTNDISDIDCEYEEDDDADDDDDEKEDNIPSLRLRGQMMYLEESDTIIFFSSPCIQTLDGLSEKGRYASKSS